MSSHGKRYVEAVKQYDKMEEYPLNEAIELVKKMATAKFDETVEMHFRLGIDPRHADQQVRSTVMLPHGLGRSVRILVFAEGDAAKAAEEAGADIIADDAIIARIQNEGWLDFDAAVAVPQMMGKVGRIARILGPRGLMPNPKAGTVVQPDDMGRVIEELKAGRVEFRNDKTANLHLPIGKASFDLDKLQENAAAALDAVKSQEPSTVKGLYIRKMVVTSTMGPGVRVNV
ncbi:50S ribosomal protein L1 [Phototrophicus methaneseepsis]|uniref:Large ribosomal subunit protein uL1 n=1 Tax=Phototrophicus methaneseepsis TaxID=2710758 RepID=A0A7S8IER2_9CHLR|nr:50S ribosomal protein L1 [Phototrophicus methaneseepsis]QPC82861.1 50S ribosomal protein L1 [Phototrophicus methaneseepsis]